MSINELIQTTRPPVSELVSGLKTGDIFVDNNFQRRLVWTEKQKVRLIDTVLSGFPMPEIYLWLQPANEETGKQEKSVVDGQQRLTAMSQFTSNEFPLSATYFEKDQREAPYVGLFWKDFPPELKRSFWEYVINVRSIPATVSAEEISNIFTRLNETDKSLNPQELRNAVFNGKFIKTAEAITILDSFNDLDIFTTTQIHRMKDIEFASGLLLFLRHGLVEENTKAINNAYDDYNEEYSESEDDVAEVNAFFTRCKNEYFKDTITKSLFSKPVHLFTLFTSEKYLLNQKVTPEQISKVLSEFSTLYGAELKSDSDDPLSDYRKGASSRTRSKSNRQMRMNTFVRFIVKHVS